MNIYTTQVTDVTLLLTESNNLKIDIMENATPTTEKLNWFQKFLKLLFIPGIIANIFNALTMDDKGYSLKKILAVYGTYIAGEVTKRYACKENAIAFVIIWLIWVGILVGIYSISDISTAISKVKQIKPDETNQS